MVWFHDTGFIQALNSFSISKMQNFVSKKNKMVLFQLQIEYKCAGE